MYDVLCGLFLPSLRGLWGRRSGLKRQLGSARIATGDIRHEANSRAVVNLPSWVTVPEAI